MYMYFVQELKIMHMFIPGVDSSEESEDGNEEVVQSNTEGLTPLSDALQSMTLHTPVCRPDRLSKVNIHIVFT